MQRLGTMVITGGKSQRKDGKRGALKSKGSSAGTKELFHCPLLLFIFFSVDNKTTQKYDHRNAAKFNTHNNYSIFSNTHAILQMVVGCDGLFPIVPKGKTKCYKTTTSHLMHPDCLRDIRVSNHVQIKT